MKLVIGNTQYFLFGLIRVVSEIDLLVYKTHHVLGVIILVKKCVLYTVFTVSI